MPELSCFSPPPSSVLLPPRAATCFRRMAPLRDADAPLSDRRELRPRPAGRLREGGKRDSGSERSQSVPFTLRGELYSKGQDKKGNNTEQRVSLAIRARFSPEYLDQSPGANWAEPAVAAAAAWSK